MLDTDTKRRIDTARDILVGKVPDPKSQVEQITIALIYKFMDDIDGQSEELGGKRTFFAGDFARYGWPKLVRSGLGGFEMLHLYAEAITRMPENPGIPPLFRSIFSNAYLPYQEPETLRAFLRIIDEFTYDHSERLGDAFEYLLSVLGSQGDAGQFRTPRHIIDFIVAVVDPKKDETVLDPACGTAGFLISSYNHIKNANTDDRGHDTLTPDERLRLAENFRGYDISPDMVRLSLANMYLHSFAAPHIYEYDTLTSDERWNDHADVILANPPFMSPKGGIRPHNRFSVQSRRSEVLFVDYIAEHLTTMGRAGIIVPEGVIFQSQRAHTQLRKMLVEQYLVAVVSLPSGVFNPYSGVKTSILILDRTLARRADRIAFFKVENDGYDLGAQRRPISQDDLPAVTDEINEYRRRLRAGESLDDFAPQTGLVVEKDRIASDGDYNLSGQRYQTHISRNSKYPMVHLGQIAELIRGVTFRKSDQLETSTDDSLRVATTRAAQESGIVEEDLYYIPRELVKDNKKMLQPGDILISTANSLNLLGRTTHVRSIDYPTSFGAFMSLIRPNEEVIDTYLLHCLRTEFAADFYRRNANTTTNISNLNISTLASFEIPLPPLEVQRDLVAEIEGYQRVIDGGRAVIDHWRPRIEVDPQWPTVELGELAKLQYGFTASAEDTGDVRLVRITDIAADGTLRREGAKFITLGDDSRQLLLAKGDVLVARTGATYGKTMLFSEDYQAVYASYLIRLRFPQDVIDPSFYWAFAQSESYWSQARALATGGGQPQFNGNVLKQIRLPVPPMATQRDIVAEIEVERSLVSANRELVELMEGRIAAAIGRVWVVHGS